MMPLRHNRIAWIVPPLQKGSGGHRTIFQNINYAVKNGYECDIYIEDDGSVATAKEVEKLISDFFGESLAKHIYLGIQLQDKYDLLMTTGWHTAGIIEHLECPRKAYFIQDYEPWFYAMGDNYLVAKQTYQLGFQSITIGRWLARKIRHESHKQVAYFDFCADLNIYSPKEIPKENAICCIYQPEKSRRCSDLLLRALQTVKQRYPDLTIYLYGSNMKANIDFDAIELGVISPTECNELYNKCRIGVSMSATNPSRIPFEMMATGLPVVDLYRENNLYDLPDDAVLLAESDPAAIVSAISKILDNEKLAQNLGGQGAKFMRSRSLETGYQQFLAALNAIFVDHDFHRAKISRTYHRLAIQNPSLQNKGKIAKYYRKIRRVFEIIKHGRDF